MRLLEMVGNSGHVVALDVAEDALDEAEEKGGQGVS